MTPQYLAPPLDLTIPYCTMPNLITPLPQLQRGLNRLRTDPRVPLIVVCVTSEAGLESGDRSLLSSVKGFSTQRPVLLVLQRGSRLERQFLEAFQLSSSAGCEAEIYCLLSNGFLLHQGQVSAFCSHIQRSQRQLVLTAKLFYARVLLEVLARRPAPYSVKTAAQWVSSVQRPEAAKLAEQLLSHTEPSSKKATAKTRNVSGRIRLGITLTTNRRILRSYGGETKLSQVLEEAQSEERNAGRSTAVVLRQVYPAKLFGQEDMERSLRALGIESNTMLQVESQAVSAATPQPLGFASFLMAWFMSILYWIKARITGA